MILLIRDYIYEVEIMKLEENQADTVIYIYLISI